MYGTWTPPSWRPSFKYYNKWVSLVGAIVCGAIMMVTRWFCWNIGFWGGFVVLGHFGVRVGHFSSIWVKICYFRSFAVILVIFRPFVGNF